MQITNFHLDIKTIWEGRLKTDRRWHIDTRIKTIILGDSNLFDNWLIFVQRNRNIKPKDWRKITFSNTLPSLTDMTIEKKKTLEIFRSSTDNNSQISISFGSNVSRKYQVFDSALLDRLLTWTFFDTIANWKRHTLKIYAGDCASGTVFWIWIFHLRKVVGFVIGPRTFQLVWTIWIFMRKLNNRLR